MKKEDKTKIIDDLVGKLANSSNFYLTDIADLTAVKTNSLRRLCFDKKIGVLVVKKSLLKKAFEKSTGRDYSALIPTLKGPVSIWFSESGSEPAKLIKEFRKKDKKPLLKAAYVEETVYVGDSQLEFLSNIKSKNEMIGEIIGLLQSPTKNVISALQSGKNKLAGIVKTLSERTA